MKFEKGPQYLKRINGKETDIKFIITVDGYKISHLLHGNLFEENNQLFFPYRPEIADGVYLQIRQDKNDKNKIDVEIYSPKNKRKVIKPTEIHHQPNNNKPFYYTSFDYMGCKIRVIIGKISKEEFFNKSLKEIMSDWN